MAFVACVCAGVLIGAWAMKIMLMGGFKTLLEKGTITINKEV